jgi:hypothetical protein
VHSRQERIGDRFLLEYGGEFLGCFSRTSEIARIERVDLDRESREASPEEPRLLAPERVQAIAHAIVGDPLVAIVDPVADEIEVVNARGRRLRGRTESPQDEREQEAKPSHRGAPQRFDDGDRVLELGG